MRYLIWTLVIILGVVSAAFFISRTYFKLHPGFLRSAEAAFHIPVGMQARTQKDYYAATHAWLLRQTVESYRKNVGTQDQDKAVIAFLKKACRAEAYADESPGWRILAEEGAKLIDAGCNDPLVRLWYGMMLFHAKEMEKAEPQLMVAYEWDRNSYPDINAFFAFRSLALIAHRKRGHRPREALNHTGTALNAFCIAVLNQEFSDSEAQIAYRLLNGTYSDRDDLPKFAFVLNALQNQSGVSQWLMDMIRADNEIDLAWDARGTGWAKDVTKEGWEQWAIHLKKACTILTATWQSDPQRPEPAGEMITVTMGGHGNKGESESTWFNRAVSAQMDYPEAYKAMVFALTPRWGGSHDEMLEFGRACLATNRFDTDVPLYYFYTLRKIGNEIENNRWRLPFRGSREQKELLRLFEGLLAEPGRSLDLPRLQTQQALVTAWSGDYSGAAQRLKAVSADVDLSDGFLGKALSWSDRSRAAIDSELRAFTGPSQDILSQAEDLELKDRIPEALALYEQAMQAQRSDAEILGYIRDRMAKLKLGKRSEQIDAPPLVLAAKDDALEVAAFLLDNDADADCEDHFYWTPLHQAAAENHEQMAELLLRHGAGLEKRAMGLFTPLHLAVKHRHPEMAVFLIQHGADVDARDSGGWTALDLALYFEMPELAVTCIRNGASVQFASQGQWTPLHHAVKHGFTDIARLLITKGAHLDDRTDGGWTPLQLAVWEGNESMVRLLIASGADVSATPPDGKTLSTIARERHFPAIEKLLQQY